MAVSSWGYCVLHKLCLTAFLFVSLTMATGQSKPLPPGPMQAKIKAACTQCHNAARITEQHKSRKEWNDQLDKMVGLGAEVPDAERARFLDYLTRNFGPEKAASKGSKGRTKKSSD